MAKPLTERLKAALGPTARASDVSDLITEVKGDLETAKADLTRYHAIAVDCGSDEAAADEAADAEHRASRRITRLEGQLAQLGTRFSEITERDRAREREEWLAGITAERDALAADLKAQWPLIEASIVHFLWRISLSDKRCASANIESAEAIARGCTNVFNDRGNPVARFVDMRLPSFAASEHWGAWPPRRNDLDWALMDKPTGQRMLDESGERVRALQAEQTAS